MTLTRRTPLKRTPMKRGRTRVKPVNVKRRQSEFARCYGSKARVAWVKRLGCLLSHCSDCEGPVENAHTATGGMGRKADAATIVPLCNKHHRALHTLGVRTFMTSYRIDLPSWARWVEERWQSFNRDTAA